MTTNEGLLSCFYRNLGTCCLCVVLTLVFHRRWELAPAFPVASYGNCSPSPRSPQLNTWPSKQRRLFNATINSYLSLVTSSTVHDPFYTADYSFYIWSVLVQHLSNELPCDNDLIYTKGLLCLTLAPPSCPAARHTSPPAASSVGAPGCRHWAACWADSPASPGPSHLVRRRAHLVAVWPAGSTGCAAHSRWCRCPAESSGQSHCTWLCK